MHLDSRESRIPQHVIQAYLDALYRIEVTPAFDLTIGEHHHGLDTLLRSNGMSSAALLTAYNPEGIVQDDSLNEIAQNQLLAILDDNSAYLLFAAEGRSRVGDWPSEKSVLIAGMDLDVAIKLGRVFNQNALVFIRYGEAPQLILLR